jgi:N-acetylneuraminic acid mutarotase
MKKNFLLSIFILSVNHFLSAQNTWTQKADFGGSARRSAIGFSIGNYGYMGTGYDANFYDDLWKFDPVNNSWTQAASYPGAARFSAVVFVIGSFAYVGTGYDVNNNFNTADFWKYDSQNNSWSQSASMPAGQERRYASAFGAQGRGYVCNGTGPSGYLNDLWEYDGIGNSWTQKANFPGAPRYECVSFTIGEFGYVGCGAFAGTIYNDFYEYQPQNNSWFQKANYPGAGGDAAAGFALEVRGYIGTGSTQGSYPTDFYEWDQANDVWTAKANFPAAGRAFGTGFSILNKGYIGTGESVSYFNDWWEYTPDTLFNSTENLSADATAPVIIIQKNEVTIMNNGNCNQSTLIIYSIDGKLVATLKLNNNKTLLPFVLEKGIYLYQVEGNKGWKSGKIFLSGE